MSEDAKERQIPLILIGVGLALYAIAAFAHAGASGVAPFLLAVIVIGIVQTILLIGAAYLVATFLSVSFGDFRAATLKFAGAALASGGLGTLLPIGGIVSSVAFLGLILWLFELELPYAIALSVVYFLLSVVVAIGVHSAFS